MRCVLAGYAGDVWFPQPAPKDHPWRTMPRHAMTPHYSGTTLDAQVICPACWLCLDGSADVCNDALVLA